MTQDSSTTMNADFVKGAVSVVGIYLVKKIYDLFQAPSVESVQAIAAVSVPKRGDDSTITIWGISEHGEFDGNENFLMDFSPYTDRVEAYLNLKKIPYTKLKSFGMMENPRRKVPFANIYGTMVDDSTRILDFLMRHFDDEPKLTERQALEGHLIRTLINGSLYWAILHMGFGTVEGRKAVTAFLAHDLPGPLKPLLGNMVIRKQHDNMQGFGIGKFTHKEIVETAKKDLKALSSLLGTRKFILDTREPTVYDTDVFVFVNHFFYHPRIGKIEWVNATRKELGLLDQYVIRMRDIIYSDQKKTN